MNIKIISLIAIIGLSIFTTATFLLKQLAQIELPQSAQLSNSQKQSVRIPEWDLYTDTVRSFTIQHPTSSPASVPDPQSGSNGAVPLLHLSTATDTAIGDLTIARSNDPIIGVSIYTSSDTGHCFDFQAPSSTVTLINTVPFKTATWSDAAMGGERGLIRQYRTLRTGTCYTIESMIHYRDISFLAGVTGKKPHTASTADLKQQADWIDQQQKIQAQIIKTFSFSQ
jgi:hypothetical protein